MTLLMMGSADALPEEPVVRPMFVEDMTEEQLASAVRLQLTDLLLQCFSRNQRNKPTAVKSSMLSVSCSDGAAVWIDESGQHMLHECNSAVSTLRA